MLHLKLGCCSAETRPHRGVRPDLALGADRDGGPWLAGEMPAAAGAAGPAGAEIRGAARDHRPRHCGGAWGGCGGRPGPFRRRPADQRPAQPGEPGLGRAGDDPEHRAQCQAPCAAGRNPWRGGGGCAVSALRASLCDPCGKAGPRRVRRAETRSGGAPGRFARIRGRNRRALPAGPRTAAFGSAALDGAGLGGNFGPAPPPGQGRPGRSCAGAGRARDGAGHRAGDQRVGRDPVRRSGHGPAADHRALWARARAATR